MFNSRLDKRQFIRFLSSVYFIFCDGEMALTMALALALAVWRDGFGFGHGDCNASITFCATLVVHCTLHTYQIQIRIENSKLQQKQNTLTHKSHANKRFCCCCFYLFYLLLLSSRWRNTFTSTRTLRFSFALALAFKQIKYYNNENRE